jgi:hypothetical protein
MLDNRVQKRHDASMRTPSAWRLVTFEKLHLWCCRRRMQLRRYHAMSNNHMQYTSPTAAYCWVPDSMDRCHRPWEACKPELKLSRGFCTTTGTVPYPRMNACTALRRYYREHIVISRGALCTGPASETVRVIVILAVGYILFQCFSRDMHPCTHATSRTPWFAVTCIANPICGP